eukprot:12936693-Prorocentrum_lima.AAC.1
MCKSACHAEGCKFRNAERTRKQGPLTLKRQMCGTPGGGIRFPILTSRDNFPGEAAGVGR